MAPSTSSELDLAMLRELLAKRDTEIAELRAEIARRDAVDAYRLTISSASALLWDRPDLLQHAGLAADMIMRGVPHAEVRVRILEMGAAPCA